jgi:hypothetical protein
VAVFGYRLKEFLPQAEKVAQQEPEALRTIIESVREKLKQVDRNER